MKKKVRQRKGGNAQWAALFVAAGQSKRLKSRVAKPFMTLKKGQTLLEAGLQAFKKVRGLAYTIVVTRKEYVGSAVGSLYRMKLSGIVTLGGEEREDSVLKGLQVVPPSVKYVLIHDAARPLVSPAVINRVLKEAVRSGAAIPVVPVKDTLKVVSGSRVVKTLDRATLRAVQTPQGFRVESLKKAFKKMGKKASGLTDDAAVAEAAGFKVAIVDGDGMNFKVTTQEDLRYARERVRKK